MLLSPFRSLFLIGFLVGLQASVHGALISPGVGYQAQLSTIARNVSGTVTILDDDSVRVDNFTYNGRGGAVYFFLGTSDSDTAFESGLQIGTRLSGTVFDGTQGPLFVDLPIGETLEGYQAFSVWCVTHSANFGSGTFLPVPVPEPTTLGLTALGALGLLLRRGRYGRRSFLHGFAQRV